MIYTIKLTKKEIDLLNGALNILVEEGQDVILDGTFKNMLEQTKFIDVQNKVIMLSINILKQTKKLEGQL